MKMVTKLCAFNDTYESVSALTYNIANTEQNNYGTVKILP
jgi:hypothetical protein